MNYYCEQIPGDAMLYSMFKIDSEPVKCPPPLKGMCLFNLLACFHPLLSRVWGAPLPPLEKKEQWKKVNQFSINRNFIGKYIDGILIKKIGILCIKIFRNTSSLKVELITMDIHFIPVFSPSSCVLILSNRPIRIHLQSRPWRVQESSFKDKKLHRRHSNDAQLSSMPGCWGDGKYRWEKDGKI